MIIERGGKEIERKMIDGEKEGGVGIKTRAHFVLVRINYTSIHTYSVRNRSIVKKKKSGAGSTP